jgi:hypothetical protein
MRAHIVTKDRATLPCSRLGEGVDVEGLSARNAESQASMHILSLARYIVSVDTSSAERVESEPPPHAVSALGCKRSCPTIICIRLKTQACIKPCKVKHVAVRAR